MQYELQVVRLTSTYCRYLIVGTVMCESGNVESLNVRLPSIKKCWSLRQSRCKLASSEFKMIHPRTLGTTITSCCTNIVSITLKEAWMSWCQFLAASFATRSSPDDRLRCWPPLAGLWVNNGRSIGRQAPTIPKDDSIIPQYNMGLFISDI